MRQCEEIMKKILIKIFLMIFLLLFIFWTVSFVKCEIFTFKYKEEFADKYLQTGMINDVDRIKVISYSKSNAKVYYSLKNEGGNLLFLKSQNEQWTLEKWKTVWSKTGTADGYIWPYIR